MATETEVDLQQELDRVAIAEGSMRQWCLKHKFSPQYVTQVYYNQRPPSDRLLSALGLERRVIYVRVARKPSR